MTYPNNYPIKLSPDAVIDDVAIGKHVRVRGKMRNGDGIRIDGWFDGTIKEIKREGQCLVFNSGWNMNLDLGDELIWCSDHPCPANVR